MEIRRRGKQPHNAFAMVPNETIRDNTLSFRSRGILTFLLSQQEGWRITSETIAAEGSEGRDAVRTALTQLETSGYIRRYRERQEDGTYKGVCDIYPYGDAVGDGTDEDVDDDPTPEEQDRLLLGVVTPVPENPSEVPPAPENPAQVSQAPYRRPSTEDSIDSPVAAAAPSVGAAVAGSPLNLTSSSVVQEDGPLPMTPRPFPRAEQDNLATWFKVTDGTSWIAAWDAAISSPTTIEYDPQVHLAEYLIKCKDSGQQKPRPDIWLKWFIEDRQTYAQKLVADAQRVLNSGITAQEREERDNRRMPPADWGVPPTTTEGITS